RGGARCRVPEDRRAWLTSRGGCSEHVLVRGRDVVVSRMVRRGGGGGGPASSWAGGQSWSAGVREWWGWVGGGCCGRRRRAGGGGWERVLVRGRDVGVWRMVVRGAGGGVPASS